MQLYPSHFEALPLITAYSSIQTLTASNRASRGEAASFKVENAAEISDDDLRLQYISDECIQIRRKIHDFINSGAMKVGDFHSAIGVTSGSYARFMKQNGHKRDTEVTLMTLPPLYS